ncbi:lytic polysaccharide monooxygenase [Streptomyces sp. 11x1]|uniref:lytic polysaccharide monooxygenase auxiliary activity family 9 protein n=1 Tax=Streptomyces sp. 11x1 TaxID=3038642 RepID=UPI00292D8A6C|nr:lytic polysaccharide monooxygenase [Streptomyces sp. 11x1]WNZ12734.1 lytic polysaccharide monooxygenase [Streptomyces sp. 11x1]
MPAARRKATASATARVVGAMGAAGVAPLALTLCAAGPAAAHGSLGDPVSRVAQCYAEGPESPRSAACRAAVTAGGTQAFYDWNGVRIGDAAGRHRELIPDGELCSAGSEAFKGLDLARSDWPATSVRAGSYTFKYRVTAPHKGTFRVYLTKGGYDPSRPLAWDDLDLANPVATATDPAASGGFYTFSGSLPQRSGKHLLYAVWQRSDSPEAFYSCSDVSFGDDDASTTTDPTPKTSAKATERTSAEKDEKGEKGEKAGGTADTGDTGDTASDDTSPTAMSTTDERSAVEAASAGLAEPVGGKDGLADTGGEGVTPYLALGGAAVLAAGSSLLFAAARRRATARGRHGR